MGMKSSWELWRKIKRWVGAPVGASISADIAAVTSDIADAVPEPPTTNSLQDTLHKDGSYTYDNTTDSFEAIRDHMLTNKEKAFSGARGQVTLSDRFQTVANTADPDTNIWTVVEDNDANVQALQGAALACNIQAGSVGANDAIMHTKDLRTWFAITGGESVGEFYSTLFFRVRFKVADLTGQFSVGLVDSTAAEGVVGTWTNTSTTDAANVYGNNDTVYFHTADGTAQATDVSGSFTNNSMRDIEIRITSVDTKLYVAGSLVATHSTNPAPGPQTYSVNLSCTNANSIQTSLSVELVEVWAE